MVTLILYITDEQSLHSERLQLLQKNNEQEKTGKALGKILPGNSIIFLLLLLSIISGTIFIISTMYYIN